MKLNELDSQILEAKKITDPLGVEKAGKGVDAIKRFSNWIGSKMNKSDDLSDLANKRIEPDLDVAKLPNVDKPRIRVKPGETFDDAVARTQAEKRAAGTMDNPAPVAAPSPSSSTIGRDMKNAKRGFKDRISDKLTKREPGVTTVSPSSQVELPKNVNVPPKMRKPEAEVPAVKAADDIPAVKAADDIPAVKAADDIPAVKAADDVADVAKKEPGIFARNKGKTAAGIYGTAAAADAALTTGGVSNPDFPAEFGKNIFAPVNMAIDKMQGAEPALDKEGNPGVPASTSAEAPDTDPDYIPPAKQEESLATLLKLTGQRPITERDNTMGIIKPKAIQTLTENAVNECGMGMMGSPSSTPASLSINATAGSGEEVANMLASIMKLAGVRPVEQDMMPQQNSNMPMMKALQIMGGPDDAMEPSSPDSMNANLGADEIELDVGSDSQSDDGSVTVRNVDTGEEHVGRDVTEPGSITVRNVDTGEEFKGKESTAEDQSKNFKANTTPQDPTDVPKFDSNKMADMRNYIDMAQIPAGAPGDNRLPKEEPKLQESSLGLDLFKAYEAFKSSN